MTVLRTMRRSANQSWSKELLACPFTAPQGEHRRESLRLQGPAGPVPVQLSAVEYWPGTTWVKSAMKLTGYSARVTADRPVFAEVSLRYICEGGGVLTLTARLAAGDAQVLWDTHSTANNAEDGRQIIVNQGLGALSLPRTGKFVNSKWGKLNEKKDIPLDQEPAGAIVFLQPWTDWWDGCTSAIWTLKAEG